MAQDAKKKKQIKEEKENGGSSSSNGNELKENKIIEELKGCVLFSSNIFLFCFVLELLS